MKCPKCKKKMEEHKTSGYIVREENNYWSCQNKKCLFFGIERIEIIK